MILLVAAEHDVSPVLRVFSSARDPHVRRASAVCTIPAAERRIGFPVREAASTKRGCALRAGEAARGGGAFRHSTAPGRSPMAIRGGSGFSSSGFKWPTSKIAVGYLVMKRSKTPAVEPIGARDEPGMAERFQRGLRRALTTPLRHRTAPAPKAKERPASKGRVHKGKTRS